MLFSFFLLRDILKWFPWVCRVVIESPASLYTCRQLAELAHFTDRESWICFDLRRFHCTVDILSAVLSNTSENIRDFKLVLQVQYSGNTLGWKLTMLTIQPVKRKEMSNCALRGNRTLVEVWFCCCWSGNMKWSRAKGFLCYCKCLGVMIQLWY